MNKAELRVLASEKKYNLQKIGGTWRLVNSVTGESHPILSWDHGNVLLQTLPIPGEVTNLGDLSEAERDTVILEMMQKGES